MRGKAKARWVMAAIAHMVQSNMAGAQVLHAYRANAATDITGFGLLGHLLEMIKASDVDASLHLLQVPLLEGLTQSMAAGIFSSLQPQNVRLRRAISNLETAATHPLYPILFDPQTAGGLLASIPTDRAQACVDALRAAGYASAAIVGRVKPRSISHAAITVELAEGRSGLDNGRNSSEPHEAPAEEAPQAPQSVL